MQQPRITSGDREKGGISTSESRPQSNDKSTVHTDNNGNIIRADSLRGPPVGYLKYKPNSASKESLFLSFMGRKNSNSSVGSVMNSSTRRDRTNSDLSDYHLHSGPVDTTSPLPSSRLNNTYQYPMSDTKLGIQYALEQKDLSPLLGHKVSLKSDMIIQEASIDEKDEAEDKEILSKSKLLTNKNSSDSFHKKSTLTVSSDVVMEEGIYRYSSPMKAAESKIDFQPSNYKKYMTSPRYDVTSTSNSLSHNSHGHMNGVSPPPDELLKKPTIDGVGYLNTNNTTTNSNTAGVTLPLRSSAVQPRNHTRFHKTALTTESLSPPSTSSSTSVECKEDFPGYARSISTTPKLRGHSISGTSFSTTLFAASTSVLTSYDSGTHSILSNGSVSSSTSMDYDKKYEGGVSDSLRKRVLVKSLFESAANSKSILYEVTSDKIKFPRNSEDSLDENLQLQRLRMGGTETELQSNSISSFATNSISINNNTSDEGNNIRGNHVGNVVVSNCN